MSENEKKRTVKHNNGQLPNRARQSHVEKEDMTPRDDIFVNEYLQHLDPRRAALAAGYSESVARTHAYQWVANSKVKPVVYNEIKKRMAERSIRTQITQDKVLEQLWIMARADVNEIVQVRRNNCRHCNGIDHAFQWKDEDEFTKALQDAIDMEKMMQKEDPDYKGEYPTDEGGYGFNPLAMPNVECPRCFGEGRMDVHYNDTRELSPGAQALYAGVKQTKEGMEVKLNDKMQALTMVARHLGMFNDKLTLRGDEENPLEVLLRSLPGNTLTPKDD